MKKTIDTSALVLLLRRSDQGGPLLSLALPKGDLRESLLIAPAALDATLPTLARLTVKLPDDNLPPVQKGQYRKVSSQEYNTVLAAFATGVRRMTAALGTLAGKLKLPDPARMDTLGKLMLEFSTISKYAAQGVNKAMDLRLLVGGFEWYLLAQVTAAVVKRMEDEKTSEADRARLQLAFSPLLQHKDQLLADRAQRAEQRRKNREQVAAQQAQSERTLTLLDTLSALHLGLPVDEQALEEAAEIYAEEKQKQTAAPPPAAGTRKARR